MSILNTIKTRRSVREFTTQEIPEEMIGQILEAGRWAPSGLNNQPWKFAVINNKAEIEQIASFTKYTNTVAQATLLIIVFLDNSEVYDRTKDVQAIGACIQNMLLTIHDLELGACWIGEILNRKDEVVKFLNLPDSLELMAVLAIGYPTNKRRISKRKRIEEVMVVPHMVT